MGKKQGNQKVSQRTRKEDLLIMHRNCNIRSYQPHHLNPLFRIHCHHQQGHGGAGDRGAAEVDEQEVDVRVEFGNLGEFGDEEGVACYVDAGKGGGRVLVCG